MKFILTLLTTCILAGTITAQEVQVFGKVTSEKTGEELIGANVEFYKNGKVFKTTSTDFEGNYKVHLPTGAYDEVKVVYPGFETKKATFNVHAQTSSQVFNLELNEGEALKETSLLNCYNYPRQLKTAPYMIDVKTTVHALTQESTGLSEISNSDAANMMVLKGKITDAETGKILIGANVAIYKGDQLITGVVCDFDGNYEVKLIADHYDIEVSYIGYQVQKILGVGATRKKAVDCSVALDGGLTLKEVLIVEEKAALIEEVIVCGYSVSSQCCYWGCSATESEALPRSVNKEEEEMPAAPFSLSYFPNPALHNLHIDSQQSLDQLIIRSMDGRALLQLAHLPKGITSIDVSNFAAGTYILQAVSGTSLVSKKFIVVRE